MVPDISHGRLNEIKHSYVRLFCMSANDTKSLESNVFPFQGILTKLIYLRNK